MRERENCKETRKGMMRKERGKKEEESSIPSNCEDALTIRNAAGPRPTLLHSLINLTELI